MIQAAHKQQEYELRLMHSLAVMHSQVRRHQII